MTIAGTVTLTGCDPITGPTCPACDICDPCDTEHDPINNGFGASVIIGTSALSVPPALPSAAGHTVAFPHLSLPAGESDWPLITPQKPVGACPVCMASHHTCSGTGFTASFDVVCNSDGSISFDNISATQSGAPDSSSQCSFTPDMTGCCCQYPGCTRWSLVIKGQYIWIGFPGDWSAELSVFWEIVCL